MTREVTTNDEGVYSAPNLLPGTYEARFSAQGFKTDRRGGIELTVGAALVLDMTLTVGAVQESVVVQSTFLLAWLPCARASQICAAPRERD